MERDLQSFFEALYKNFNDRNIDAVIAEMTADVQWANGMEGGYVYGHKAVKDYWARQFQLVSSKVIPLEIKEKNNGVHIKVQQVVHDIYGDLLADEIVEHVFYLQNGKISRFDIGKKKDWIKTIL
jgi:hypothetical protein